MKKNLYIKLGVLLFLSCSKEVEIKIPKHKSQLVVNCLFQPEKTFTLTLGESKTILDDTDSVFIDDALVILSQNDKIIDTLIWQEKNYTSSIQSIIEANYQLQIEHQGKLLQASDFIPSKPEIQNVFYRDSVYVGDTGDQTGYFSQLSISIVDQPKVDNFYELILFFVEKNCPAQNTSDNFLCFQTATPDTQNNDPVILNSSLINNYYAKSLLFSDQLFNGTSYTLKLNFRTPSAFFYESNTLNEFDYILKFRNVSKHYYQYRNNLFIHLNNQESDVWDGTGEPISVYSNVTNGLGIFAGYNEVIDTLQKRFPQ